MNNSDKDIDYNISEKNTDGKFMAIVKKIFIVLTILAVILGIAFSFFCIYTSFTMDSIEFLNI